MTALAEAVGAYIALPFPPSTNNLFANVGKRRIVSSRYESWRREAGWELQSQRPRKIAGPVTITITLCAPDKRRRDADNSSKAVIDLLVTHRVIEADDSRIVRKVTIEWVDTGATRAHCVVHVAPVFREESAT